MDKTETCGNCKWWDEVEGYTFNECLNKKVAGQVLPEEPIQRIEFGFNFGCIHFEAKEKQGGK